MLDSGQWDGSNVCFENLRVDVTMGMYLGVGMLGWSTGAYVHVSFDPIDILCPTIFQVRVMSSSYRWGA